MNAAPEGERGAFYQWLAERAPETAEGFVFAACRARNAEERASGVEALGRLGHPTAYEALREARLDPRIVVRLAAIKGLGLAANPRAIDVLVATLHDRNRDLRDAAFEALRAVGDRHGIEPLRPLLSDGRYGKRTVAAALRALGEPTSSGPPSPDGFEWPDIDELEEIG